MVARKSSKLHLAGVLTLGFALGAVAAGVTIFSISNSSDPSKSAGGISSGSGNSDSQLSLDASLGSASAEFLADGTRVKSLIDVSRLASEFEQSAALYPLLLGADRQGLLEYIEQSKEISPPALQHSMQESIFQRLATVDGDAALAQAKKFPKHQQDPLIRAIFMEWSNTDLDKTVKAAKSLDGPQQIAALQGILQSRTDLSEGLRREIARDLGNEQIAIEMIGQLRAMELMDNPETAWFAMVSDTNQEVAQPGLLIQIGNAWVRQQGLSVLGKISESLTDWRTRSTVVGSLIRSATLANPQDALNQALRMQSHEGEWAPIVAREWARSEPRTAFDAVTNVSPSGLRRTLQESVVRSWAQNDPHMLLEDLSLLPKSLQDLATEQAILSIAKNEPLEAVDLMASVEDDSSRHMIAYSVVSSWSNLDPVAAVNWVLSNPDLERMRYELLAVVFRNLALENPQLAMELALKQPIEQHQRGLEATVIGRLAQVDLEHALALLSQVRQGQTQIAAFMSVGSQLVRNNDMDRALKLGEQLGAEWRDSYYQSIMSTWANMDPEGLLATLDKLPSAATKSKAALSLARSNQFRKILTTDQIAYAKTYLTEKDAERIDTSLWHSFSYSDGGVFVTTDLAADSVVATPEVIVTGQGVEPLIRYEIQSRLDEEDEE